MKVSRFIKHTLAFALLLAVARAGGSARAEAPDVSALDLVMARLFSTNTAFTAKSDLRVLDSSQRETTRAALNYAVLSGKIRTEIDMSQARSAHTPATATATMKAIGEVVTITRPDKRATLLMYPNLRCYSEIPFTKSDPASIQGGYRLEKTRLGIETVDGHPCEKDRVVLTGEKGERVEATVWFASDLRAFPLQIQTEDQGEIHQLRFRDIKLGRPDARQFEVPAGLAKYDSAQMIKKLSGPDAQK